MLEGLKDAFYEVMYKYDKPFGEDGVMANLNEWAKNKEPLIQLLRRHPNWIEKEKAVVINFKEGRGIDRGIIDEISFFILSSASEILTNESMENFRTAFQAATAGYSSTVSEENLEIIRNKGEIKCVSGQKTSRIIGRLCSKFGVDKHEGYDRLFAQLADALNPLQIDKTAVLSVHPCDYLEMSNKDNTWTSCHNLDHGSWQTGTLSYMTDAVSMIFFTVDQGQTGPFYRAPRRGRQMFFYTENLLFQSRQYPKNADDMMAQYRGIVQKIIAVCLGVPNRWRLKTNRAALNACYTTDPNGMQYPDYDHYGTLSLLRDVSDYGHLHIGHAALCVCCGQAINKANSLHCGKCPETVVCKECGQTLLKEDAHLADGAYYCPSCLQICADCGKSIMDEETYSAVDQKGKHVKVCASCYQNMQGPCLNCSVRSICRIIGNSLCEKKTSRFTA